MKHVVQTKTPEHVIEGGKGRENAGQEKKKTAPNGETLMAMIDLRVHYVGPVLEAILRLAH